MQYDVIQPKTTQFVNAQKLAGYIRREMENTNQQMDLTIHAMGHQARSIQAAVLEAVIAAEDQNVKKLRITLQAIQDCADQILETGRMSRL